MSVRSPDYRPDIDGLRGWAVAFVILFHLDLSGFQGGYTGVDVFFVISGFLITRKIAIDSSKAGFSFSRFYLGRARRLFPALFFTSLLSFLAGAVLFAPEHFAKLSQSIVAVLLFGSNFYFWLNSGYFDLSAIEQPLLHTWSLSVEEQFYFIWPCLMFFFYRPGRDRQILCFLLAMCAVGVCSAEMMLDVDAPAAFYLVPFRIFELGCGAAMVWLVNFQPRRRYRWLHELLVPFGFALILYPILTFTRATPFPGIMALPTVLGTALLIYGGSARYTGRVLDNPLSVGLGLVSYSLYLVHWPIIVFYRYWKFDGLTPWEQVGSVAVSIALATFMYFWIETPFRYPKSRSRNKPNQMKQQVSSPTRFVSICVLLAVCLAGVSAHAYRSGGWIWRMPDEIRHAIEFSDVQTRQKQSRIDQQVAQGEANCFFPGFSGALHRIRNNGCLERKPNRENYLLLGDSQGAHFLYGLKTVFPEKHFLQATLGSCVPFANRRAADHTGCRDLGTYIFKEYLPEEKEIEGVILSANWKKRDLQKLSETIDYLLSIGHRPILFGPSPEYKIRMSSLIARHGRIAGLEKFLGKFRLSGKPALNEAMRQMAADKEIDYVSILDLACPEECTVFFKGAPLIRDQMHFTKEGSEYIVRQVEMHTRFFD